MILSAVVFLQPLPDAAQSKLQKKYMPKKVSSQILTSQFLIHNVGQGLGVRLRIINSKTGQLCVGCMYVWCSVSPSGASGVAELPSLKMTTHHLTMP